MSPSANAGMILAFLSITLHAQIRSSSFSIVLSNTVSDRRFSVRFWLPAIPIACGIFLVAAGVDLGVVRNWVLGTGDWAPLAFVITGTILLTLLVPKTAVSLISGAIFGTVIGSLLMLGVAVSAAAVNYAIGRWWLQARIDRALLDSPRTHWFHAMRDVAADSGFRFHFLLRLTPLPTAVISYAMGASGSRFRPFLLGAAAAVLPQSLWVHGGTAVAAIDEPGASPLRWLGVLVSMSAAVALSIVIPRLAMKRMEAMTGLAVEGARE